MTRAERTKSKRAYVWGAVLFNSFFTGMIAISILLVQSQIPFTHIIDPSVLLYIPAIEVFIYFDASQKWDKAHKQEEEKPLIDYLAFAKFIRKYSEVRSP